MILQRSITQELQAFSEFPVVVLLGPRQSGKTTLVREVFKKHYYATLEDPETLADISKDPKGFLLRHEDKHGIIFDEFQYMPKLLSYIQLEVDTKDRPGYFVLTGSQNFLMNQAITQSLAGRAGILHLLPLSIEELRLNGLLPATPEKLIRNGGYPRIYAKKVAPRRLFPSYIRTYIERDVRQLSNIGNMRTFQKFMKLCAGRIGQQLNIADLATQCGINQRTASQWISLLEASYIIFLLKPHFTNFNKRITKLPKLYFYDTGLACALLGIRSNADIHQSIFWGPLFESLVIADFYKQYCNLGLEPALYYWRDQNGRVEVDCIIDAGDTLIPVEIKGSVSIATDFFTNLESWSALAERMASPERYVVYAGTKRADRQSGSALPLADAGSLIATFEKESD